MKLESASFKEYLKTISSRHHYIPRFLINGFTNSKKLLYIYNKQSNEILKNPRSARSIFFENDRNTLDLGDTRKTSILEELLYKEIDDKTSKVVRQYQSGKLSEIKFTNEDTSTFLFFLVSLFWRIPKTDYAANELMDRATIITDKTDSESLRTDPVYRKINRAGLFRHHINEMVNSGKHGNKRLNIHEFKEPIYLLGDYPILFRKQPSLFSEFNQTDILFALNSNRVYSSTTDQLTNFSIKNALLYNACIIDQSVNYVAGGNADILRQSVNLYQQLRQTGLIYSLRDEVFKTQ